ncbi:hypothetical protein GBAR_LOCUS30508, partial [Geodia barretti]
SIPVRDTAVSKPNVSRTCAKISEFPHSSSLSLAEMPSQRYLCQYQESNHQPDSFVTHTPSHHHCLLV